MCAQRASELEDISTENTLGEDEARMGTWVLGGTIANVSDVKIKGTKFKPQCVVDESAVSSVPLLSEQRYNSSAMFQQLHAFAAGWEHAKDEPGDR